MTVTGKVQKFRMREKGVLNSRTNQRGDQIVEVAITAPDPRDERTRKLLTDLAEIYFKAGKSADANLNQGDVFELGFRLPAMIRTAGTLDG